MKSPTPHDLNSDFYEMRASEKNPTTDNPEMTGLVRRIANWCSVEDGLRVLDVGCYDGYILRRLRARARIEGIGVDISPTAVISAKHMADREGLDGLEFIVTDGTNLPFSDDSFDVVVCSEILEHVADLDAALSEISRVLTTGGRLYATMPNSLSDVWQPLHGICRHVDRVEGHVRRMTSIEFRAALQRHNLQPTHMQYRGFILSALWYSTLIYNPRIKQFGVSVIAQKPSFSQRLLRLAAYSGMHIYIGVDRLFASSRRCMGIDAALCKI